MKKPTFEQFLRNIHNLTLNDYRLMNYDQKKATELDYKIRYGSPIKWYN